MADADFHADALRRPARRTMLLIHGAWQGAWAWQAWLPELRRLGWRGLAVDLPGNGCNPSDRSTPADVSLALYVTRLRQIVEREPGPVVVVGHSGGGVVASQLAEAVPGRVSALVYLAGMMLPSGMRWREVVEGARAQHPGVDFAGIVPHLRWSADGQSSEVPPEAARRIFLHDCDATAAADAAARLTPQPERGRDVAPTLSHDRYGRVPRLYVEATADRSLHPLLQQRLLTLSPGAVHRRIDSGHVPQLTRPRALAELVCRELDLMLAPRAGAAARATSPIGAQA